MFVFLLLFLFLFHHIHDFQVSHTHVSRVLDLGYCGVDLPGSSHMHVRACEPLCSDDPELR